MFKITANPQFTRTVKIMVPVNDGFDTQTCKATFRVIDSDDEQDTKFDLDTVKGSIDLVRAVLVSLDDLEDDTGRVTYTPELRDQLLKVPYVRAALARTYFAEVTKASVGN
jgi:hypothetical protein